MSFRDLPTTKLSYLMKLQRQLRWFELDYLGLDSLDLLRSEVDKKIAKIVDAEKQ